MRGVAISRKDVERVQAIAQATQEERGWQGDSEAVASAEILIEFCEVLLGRATVDDFLRTQDMA